MRFGRRVIAVLGVALVVCTSGAGTASAIVPKTLTDASAVQVTKTVNAWQQTGRLGDQIRLNVKVLPSYFPAAKVVGGVDLAGDEPGSAGRFGAATPTPGPNPIACGEHGTLVAGCEIKVFGCKGSTDLTGQALDRTLDPDGRFVRKPARDNVLAVVSGGDDGDVYDIGGAPGDTEALTVASTKDPSVLRYGTAVTAPADVVSEAAGRYGLAYSGIDQSDLAGPVVPLTGETKDGCEPVAEPDKAAVADKFVRPERGDNDKSRPCGSVVRADNAEAAGAVGVSLSAGTDQFSAGNAGNAGNASVPVCQFTGTTTRPLRSALRAGALQVRLFGSEWASGKSMSPETSDPPGTFTSRGVRGPPVVKPDVAVPVDTFASALRGSGAGMLVISGTSAAAPHVAALVRQAHPGWTPEGINATVLNTARGGVHTGPNGAALAPHRVGAGRVDVQSAVDSQVLAMVLDLPGAVRESHGTAEVAGPMSVTRPVRVADPGSQQARFVASDKLARIPGVRFELTRGPIQVAPRSAGPVSVTSGPVSVILRSDDPRALRKTIDPTVATTRNGIVRQFVADDSGRLVRTPATGPAPRLPVHAASRPVPSCRRELTNACTVNDTAKTSDLRYVGVAATAPYASKRRGSDAWVVNTVDLTKPDTLSMVRTPLNGLLGDTATGLLDYPPPGADPALIDSAGPRSFDPVRPALSVSGQGEEALLVLAEPGTSLTARRDKSAMAVGESTGLLVLNHRNAGGNRASVVRVPAG
ncbi:MAG: S8 family serine peptidase [Kibdelosporangium sp.]